MPVARIQILDALVRFKAPPEPPERKADPSSTRSMSSPLSAQPLKVASVNGSSKGDQGSRTPVASRGASPGPSKPLANPADISSPHELTAFVRFLLFPPFPPSHHSHRWKRCSSSSMRNSTICPRRSSIAVRCPSRCFSCFSLLISHARTVVQMSQRVDALEASIQDIINGDAPSSSAPSIPPSPRRSASTPQSKRK